MISSGTKRSRWPVGLTLLAAFALAGCDTMGPRQQGTAKGAAAGAVAGAVIGSVTGGHAGQSALIGGAVGAVAGNLWSKHMEDKRKALETATAGTGIEVARTADNRLKVNVPSDFSFDVGRANVKPSMRPVLDELAANLDKQVTVSVTGHTDGTGTDAINDPLSLDRAEAVRDYLSLRGVPVSRLTVSGAGSHSPVASNATEEGRARNRRVEIYLVQHGAG